MKGNNMGTIYIYNHKGENVWFGEVIDCPFVEGVDVLYEVDEGTGTLVGYLTEYGNYTLESLYVNFEEEHRRNGKSKDSKEW